MEPGTLLGGRFRLGAHQERSRRGEVFAAVDEGRNQAPCHIELVTYSGFLGEELEALAEREVTISGRLGEVQGLIGALGWGRLGPDRLFVAREVVAGARLINLSAGSLPDRLRLVQRVAQRVAALHAAGAVHRDLSPLTIRTGPGPADVWLGHLGLAQLEGVEEPPLDVRGMAVSYLPCAAPELLDAPDEATPTTDVYALGVLIHLALSGAAPFPGPTLVELIRQQEEVRWGRRPLPPGPEPTIPKPILEVCRRALPLDPKLRFPDAGELLEALDEALEPLGQPAPETPPAPEPTPAPAVAEIDPASTPSADQRRILSEALGDTREEELLAAETDPALEAVPEPLPERPLRDPFESDDGLVVEEVVPSGEETDELLAPEAFAFSDPLEESAVDEASDEQASAEEAPEEAPAEAAASDDQDAGFGTMMLQLELPQDAVESWKPSTQRLRQLELEQALAAKEEGERAPNETDEVEVPDVSENESGVLSVVEEEPPAPAAAPAASEDDEEEPEELSPEEALAALEAVTREVDLVPLHPPPATQDEVLEAFGPEEDAEAASPDEVLAALGLGNEQAIEDASTDIVAALPDGPGGDGAHTTSSGRFDLGALDLTESELALQEEEEARELASAPPPSSSPLPSLPELPKITPPEPEPPVELLPPVAFPNLAAHGKALVLTVEARDFAPAVDCAHRVDPDGFDLLLLDMTSVKNLGGRQLEDLTAILTYADRKQIQLAMFGLIPNVRQLITLMASDLGEGNLPPALAAQDLEAALTEAQAQHQG